MTGEPSTDDLMAGWQPLGESTSARLRSVEHELSITGAELDQAAQDREDLRSQLRRAEQDNAVLRSELGGAYQESMDLRAQLERELQRRAWVHEALTSVTVENQRLQAVLNQAIVRFAGEVQRLHGLLDQARAGICGMYVARDDYGLTCLDCDQPIVRGQAVESQPEGAFRHAACPNPTKEN